MSRYDEQKGSLQLAHGWCIAAANYAAEGENASALLVVPYRTIGHNKYRGPRVFISSTYQERSIAHIIKHIFPFVLVRAPGEALRLGRPEGCRRPHRRQAAPGYLGARKPRMIRTCGPQLLHHPAQVYYIS